MTDEIVLKSADIISILKFSTILTIINITFGVLGFIYIYYYINSKIPIKVLLKGMEKEIEKEENWK